MSVRLPDPIAGYCPHGVMVAVTVEPSFVAEEMGGLRLATVKRDDIDLRPCDDCEVAA